MEMVRHDLRYGLRLAARTPGVTLVSILTLALGIGATTALFSVTYAVLLRPLPYAEPHRLVVMRAAGATGQLEPVLSGAELRDLRAATRVFAQVGGLVSVVGNLTSTEGDRGMEQVPAANATDDFLPMLGVKPALGRFLDEQIDNASDRVLSVVLSHELWQRRFGSDPALVGRRIEINNMDLTVVGILPPGFRIHLGEDANVLPRIDIWFAAGLPRDRRERSHATIARLAPGVTLEQARAELNVISAQLTAANPEVYQNAPLRLSADLLQADMARPARPALFALMGAVAFVLLIACANVASLLIARTTARARELAVRTAIGAARSRLLRQLLTEGLVLGLAGGAAGVLVALWVETLLVWMRPPTLPPVEVNALDSAPLAFAAAVTLLATVVFSLAPAFQGTRTDPQRLLNAGGRSLPSAGRRVRTMLVVTEIALSIVLLVGAGLMLRTLVALASVDAGFDSRGVLTLQASMQPRQFREFDRKWQFYSAALERLRELPGVQSVGGVRPLPLESTAFTSRFVADSGREQVAASHTTLPGYFKSMGIRVLGGREFEASDLDEQRSVVIVDEVFARRMWPDGNAIGRSLGLRRGTQDQGLGVVIGVVSPVRAAALAAESAGQVYVPYHRNAIFDMAIVLRTSGDPMRLAAGAKKSIEELGGKRPVHDIRPMSAYVSDALAERRFLLLLLGAFAGLALLLCAVGLYGLISQAAVQRTREIGIRLALGATPRDILQLVLGEGLTYTLAGTGLGVGAALLTTRAIRSLLYGVSTIDLPTLGAVSLLLLSVSAIACYLPARRAAKVDPRQSLALE